MNSTKFIFLLVSLRETWDVGGRGGTWANIISGKGLEIGKDWNLSNFKLLYRIR